MTRKTRVELCYVGGCPSMSFALENAHAALRAEGLASEVIVCRVDSATEALDRRLVGSPTIRIDGEDVEGPAADERGYGLACRVYAGDAGPTGWPSVELIRAALCRRAIGDTVR